MIDKPVLLVVASEGYQHIEFGHTKEVIEAAGLSIKTASNSSIPAIGKDGSTTIVDVTIDKANPTDYAGIFFIGGPGALECLDNEQSYTLCKKAAAKKMPLGAICISTRILAVAGVLDQKKATGWNDDKKLNALYDEHNVTLIPEPVVVDDNIITATGPAAAKKFGQEIVTLIKKQNA